MSERKRILIQVGLFITTLLTTTVAGAEWSYGKSLINVNYAWIFTWQDFLHGLEFSIPFLLILTTHEFGHYFAAKFHKVKVSLPYYIPFPPLILPFSIGTLGAVIRIRERIYSKKQNFDIGLAGPLAGFIMALIVLFYGFVNLPEPEYIFQHHPEYAEYGLNYAEHVYGGKQQRGWDIVLGKNLVFLFFETYVADHSRVPNPHEIMHYPVLFAGFLSLVFTFLNLFPVGQLDGGHIAYGLFGIKIHRIVAGVFFIGLLFYAGLGFITPNDEHLPLWIVGSIVFLYTALTGFGMTQRNTLMYSLVLFAIMFFLSWQFPNLKGYSGWLLFVLVIGRFVGVQHPPSEIEEPLDTKRIILGWIALIIFVFCFVPSPITIIEPIASKP